jgi:hypothetical protein
LDGEFETNKRDPSEEKAEELEDRRKYLVEHWRDVYDEFFTNTEDDDNQNNREKPRSWGKGCFFPFSSF